MGVGGFLSFEFMALKMDIVSNFSGLLDCHSRNRTGLQA